MMSRSFRGSDVVKRVERRRQSGAAQHLLDRLASGMLPTASSKSHNSRGMVAAAVGNADELMLGIDIEWMNPDRPFAEIAGTILESTPAHLRAAEFYRCWTFAEAYLKAFGRLPPANGLLRLAESAASQERCRLDDGTTILQHRVAGAFQWCVVWRALADQMCSVRFAPLPNSMEQTKNGASRRTLRDPRTLALSPPLRIAMFEKS